MEVGRVGGGGTERKGLTDMDNKQCVDCRGECVGGGRRGYKGNK